MKNKVLIKIILPQLGREYDIFIPVNVIIWKIKKLAIKAISDLESGININEDFIMLNKTTGRFYKNNEIVINTDIRNSSEIVIISSGQAV